MEILSWDKNLHLNTNCRSWREFPHPDEEDVEGAESREHRRWIERMNSKLREKGTCTHARTHMHIHTHTHTHTRDPRTCRHAR